MKKKIKFKGRLKSYMCWPLYLTFVWICADGIALRYDRRLGYGMVGFTVFYFALVLFLYVRSKSVVANELISFATQYSSVQKRLLNEFEVPYALLEYSGKILWVNDKFAELMGVDKKYHKSITTLFPTVTRELLTKSDAPTDFKIVNEEEDRIGLVNGGLLGIMALVFLGIYVHLFKGYTWLGAFAVSGCVGVSLLVAMAISSLVGTVIPMFFHKIKIDPAVASGPLITTVNDLVAVVTYYGLAFLFLIEL